MTREILSPEPGAPSQRRHILRAAWTLSPVRLTRAEVSSRPPPCSFEEKKGIPLPAHHSPPAGTPPKNSNPPTIPGTLSCQRQGFFADGPITGPGARGGDGILSACGPMVGLGPALVGNLVFSALVVPAFSFLVLFWGCCCLMSCSLGFVRKARLARHTMGLGASVRTRST